MVTFCGVMIEKLVLQINYDWLVNSNHTKCPIFVALYLSWFLKRASCGVIVSELD